MGLKGQVIIMGLAFVVYKFFTNPPPQLSENLQSWKETGAYFTFNGLNIFYKDRQGTGKSGTLVCLHGFPTLSYDWSKILPGLEGQFKRVILLDFVGFGFSDKPYQHNYTIGEQADIIEHLLKQLKIKEIHLITHDYGDTVGQELVARFNERSVPEQLPKLLSLCMLNGGLFLETYYARPLQNLLLTPVLGQMLSGLMFYQAFRRSLGEVFGPETQPSEEDFMDLWAGLRFNYGDRVNYRILQYLPERYANKDRWVGALQQTSIPVHMIYGPADPVNPPEFIVHYRKVIPNPSIAVLSDKIGHYPQWEAPDDVLEFYLQFVNNLPRKDRQPGS